MSLSSTWNNIPWFEQGFKISMVSIAIMFILCLIFLFIGWMLERKKKKLEKTNEEKTNENNNS
jgi:hypothetical protein